jgi:glucosamine--fructose-6-phosphate aminotransferase (isomerizing)
VLEASPLAGTIGIGHTRWATHGKPSSATPIRTRPTASRSCTTASSRISASCGGAGGEGHVFESETDTEIVAHLVTSYLERQMSPERPWPRRLKRLRAPSLLAILFNGEHDC